MVPNSKAKGMMTCNGCDNDRMVVVARIVITHMHEPSDDDKKETRLRMMPIFGGNRRRQHCMCDAGGGV